MLIVNADDLGATAGATDAICHAFDAGTITSASAMVWMDDSARACVRAKDLGMPTGLHLNLTLPFTALDVPRSVRERHLRLTEPFTGDGWRGEAGRRLDRRLLSDAIGDQLERFCEQFGQPTHIDGHHHVHQRDPVLDILPSSWPIRPQLRAPAQADAQPSRAETSLRARFATPDFAFAFVQLHPGLGGAGFAALDRAQRASVEVMTHPNRPGELDALLSPEWRQALAALPLGSYADLATGCIPGDA